MTDGTATTLDPSALIASAVGGENFAYEPATPAAAEPAAVKEQPKMETPAATPAPVVEAPKVEETKPEVKAEEKPAETPAAEPAAVEDSIDKYLAAKRGATPEIPALDDAAKAALKARGIEDVDKFLQERAASDQLLTQYKTKAEAYDQYEKALKDLPVEIGQAIEAFRKGEDYTKPLAPLSKGITLSKEGKDIDKFDLVDNKFPGKFTADQIASIKDGTADPNLVAAHDLFVEHAINKHDGERKAWIDSGAQRQQQTAAAREADQRSIAAAIAHAKADPATAVLLTPEILADFEKGVLVDKHFYNPDGTHTLTSLALAVKALNHDTVVDRAVKGATAKGEAAGAVKVLERMPDKPSTTGGEQKGPTTKTQENETVQKLHDGVQDLIANALN